MGLPPPVFPLASSLCVSEKFPCLSGMGVCLQLLRNMSAVSIDASCGQTPLDWTDDHRAVLKAGHGLCLSLVSSDNSPLPRRHLCWHSCMPRTPHTLHNTVSSAPSFRLCCNSHPHCSLPCLLFLNIIIQAHCEKVMANVTKRSIDLDAKNKIPAQLSHKRHFL